MSISGILSRIASKLLNLLFERRLPPHLTHPHATNPPNLQQNNKDTMSTEKVVKLAILIDADNAQPSVAGALLAEVAKYGTAFVRRAYGDWTGTSLKGWKDQLLTQSIQPIQQFAYTQGKNATDSAMIIDAMDLLYTNRFDGFCLVSSDSDFTRLAARIRESGLVVYGFGERKTPKPFVSACDKFIYFDNLTFIDDQIAVAAVPPPTTPGRERSDPGGGGGYPLSSSSSSATPIVVPVIEKRAPATAAKDVRLQRQLRMAVEASSDEEGWANLAKVGALINKQHPDFDPRTFGYLKLSDLIIATGLFDFDRRSPGEGKAIVVYARDKRRSRLGPSGGDWRSGCGK